MTLASLSVMFSEEEAENLRKEFVKRGTKIKEITNKAYHDYTSVKEFHEKCMDIRYINPSILTIDPEILIYNDIVAFYSYDKNVYAVEIKNEKFAKSQMDIFEVLWKKAERPILGVSGRTSII